MIRDLRDLFAYQNAMTYSEVDKSLNEKCKQYSFNFHEFAKNQAENLTQVLLSIPQYANMIGSRSLG